MRPNCLKCRYYRVTWEPGRPRGCQAYGFKTKSVPAQVVLATTGEECRAFTPKEKASPKNGREDNAQ